MKKKLVCIVVLALALCSFVSAEEWRLGVMSEVEFLPYKSVKRDVTAYPMIHYDGNRFYIEGDEAGIYFLKNEYHQLSLGLGYDWQSFKPKDSRAWQLKQLNKRKSSIMANVDYTLITSYGALSTELSADILGRNKGMTLDIGYLAVIETDNITFIPNIGIVGYNSRYNNYYYGISANESYRSGLTQYKSKAGINPYAELSVVYQVAPQWEMSVTGRYEYLSKKVRNSPMVNKKESSLLKLGVLYQF